MLQIRDYRDDDFSALGAIFLRAIRQTASHDYSPRQVPPGRRSMRRAGGKRDSRVLVAVIDRQPVSFISAIGSDIDLPVCRS